MIGRIHLLIDRLLFFSFGLGLISFFLPRPLSLSYLSLSSTCPQLVLNLLNPPVFAEPLKL